MAKEENSEEGFIGKDEELMTGEEEKELKKRLESLGYL